MRNETTTHSLRLLALILVLALTLSSPAWALSWILGEEPTTQEPTTQEPTTQEPTTQEPAASQIQDDGELRVYLKSMGDPEQLDISLDGVYTVENDAGFRFASGARIQLYAANERIYLSVSGLTIDMGTAVTLTRQADGDEKPGMYIDQAELDTRYSGDLSISLTGEGGLKPVLTIFVEDYLYGVVAYEMSDSFPLEALKAQAVAARTYAMQRKWNAGTRDYDLVDTTADQVFKGYDAQYQNVVAAVDATRGVVGMYQGAFATCYYTASNGGQTALPSDVWSSDGDFGYLARTEDPYDLENPKSRVNSATIGLDGSGNDALHDMLLEKLKAAVDATGLQYADLDIAQIVSMEMEDAKEEGSLMYGTISCTLKAKAKIPGYYPQEGDVTAPLTTQAPQTAEEGDALFGIGLLRRWLLGLPYAYGDGDWQEQDGEYVVTLLVYDDIKDSLGLGINSSDVELASVTKDDAGYTISLRRFGHGVGMSQRGAQWMAGQYEKTYAEILLFYYPGMTLEAISWNEKQLTPLAQLPSGVGYFRPDPTPAPTPAPLPALEEGERYAVVTVKSGSALNVRENPSTSARVVDSLDNGRRVIVTKDAGDGWVCIRTAEFTGYVKSEYLMVE